MSKRTRVTRSSFLKIAGATGFAGSALSVFAACQINDPPPSSGGDRSAGKKLSFYNRSDYVAKNTIPSFETKTEIRVTQDFFSSDKELLASLQAGGTGYDVIVPSDYIVEIMARSKILTKLDMSKIPNFENVGENFKGLPYDPQNNWSVPYQWGTTGILYNRKRAGEVKSWDAAWDAQFKGKIGMLDDVRETIGASLMRLGYSANSKEPNELAEAEAALKRQKPLLKGYFDSPQNRSAVQSGNLWLGHVFSGDGILAATQNEDLAYTIPTPRATRWTDNLAIPKGARHVDSAYKFINHILDAKVGAELSNYTYYGTPNEAALPQIADTLAESPTYLLPDEVFDRLEIIRDLKQTARDYERMFAEVKSL